MAKKKAERKAKAEAKPEARAIPKGSPFGEASRVELLESHLRQFGDINATNAWRFVYEELLWFDKSTGLVHLYESDKVRPGRSSWPAPATSSPRPPPARRRGAPGPDGTAGSGTRPGAA